MFLISGAFLIVVAVKERFHGWTYFLGNGALNILMGLVLWGRGRGPAIGSSASASASNYCTSA